MTMTYGATFKAVEEGRRTGRRKITQYTRVNETLGLAISIARAGYRGGSGLCRSRVESGLPAHDGGQPDRRHDVLMWLGEQITGRRGLGNGISILIFAGIAAGHRFYRWSVGVGAHGGDEHPGDHLHRDRRGGLVTYFVVFVERWSAQGYW